MDINTFKRLAENYKTIPVYKRILADLLTPISAYMKLIKKSDYAFILELSLIHISEPTRPY